MKLRGEKMTSGTRVSCGFGSAIMLVALVVIMTNFDYCLPVMVKLSEALAVLALLAGAVAAAIYGTVKD